MNLDSLATILGALGGFELIKWLLNYYANRRNVKRKQDSEGDIAETEADDKQFESYIKRIDELNKANMALHEQNLELIKGGARKDDIIQDKESRIRKLTEELVAATRKNGHLDKQIQYYKNWKCFREFGSGETECDRRKPKQNPPLKYAPLTETD